jgi:hypothetical protein
MFGETKEDVGIKRQRIARNYQEATADTQAALANRGLSFGGTRQVAEEKLKTGEKEDIGDLHRAGSRQLGGGQQEFERLYGSSALPGLPSMDFYQPLPGQEQGVRKMEFGRNLEDIGRDRAQNLEIEYQRRKANRELPV